MDYMEEKSRFYKDVLQLHEENELQELFSPFNYIHDKISSNLGTGTGLFKSLPDALRHGDRNENFSNIQYGVMGVEVPKDKYFYDAKKPLCDQNKYIQDCLFDSYALEVLFQFEFNRLKNKITWKIAEDKIVDTKKYRDEAFKKFYEEKKKKLFQIKSGEELINFVAMQTGKNDKVLASTFLCWSGIYGMRTSNPEAPFEYLLFDFSEQASTTGFRMFETRETTATTVKGRDWDD